MRPQVGQIINNKYRLLRLIGDGGMGSVFEARHEGLATTVALKFLHPELTRRPGLVQRFLQEARVSAQIQSPHVVKVTDVDQTSTGLAFIVMEYLEGKTLQVLYEDLYREGRRLPYVEALEYAMQMLEGVEAAHATGIVHRDLKPDNVMIVRGKRGEPIIKLLDFGIAKLKVSGQLDRGLTRPGVIMGTPEYMAPEQAYSADAVDARADIFSLGVIIFEMLAGRRPVGGEEPQQIASQYLSGQVARLSDLVPSIAPQLASAVHRAMSAMAKDRFATVADFREALEPFAVAAKAPSAMAAQHEASRVSGAPAPAVTPEHVFAVGPSDRRAPAPDAAIRPATSGASLLSGAGSVPKTIPPDGPSPDAASALPSPAPMPGPSHVPYPTTASNPALPPNGGIPATSGYDPLQPGAYGVGAPRPGGTAVSGDGGPPMLHSGATQHGYAADAHAGAGTAPMDPLPGAPPMRAAARRSGGVSLITILVLAGSFAGVAVGGVYLASQVTAKESDDRAAPIAPATSPTPTADPRPPVATSPAVPPSPDPQPVPKPNPVTPGSKPNPTAKPTTQPPILPTVFVLPSAIPFPFPPGLGGPPPQQSPQTPQSPQQPSPTPSTQPSQPPLPGPATSGGGKRPQIVIPVPNKNLVNPAHSHMEIRRFRRIGGGRPATG